MKKKIIFIVNILICALSLSACTSSIGIDYVETENTTYTKIENDVTSVYETVSKGCVGIYASNEDSAGSGSGVIYKKNGDTYYVVTNAHVVEDMTTYKIYLGGIKYYTADLIGYDSTNDVAVLTFNLDLLDSDIEIYVNEISTDNTDVVSNGQTVIAIGCPLDITNYNVCSTGVVSYVESEKIMHTAAINPGNSGGGLFNLSGRLIGLNFEKEVYTTSSSESGITTQIPVEGMGYAISMDVVKQCIDDIEEANTNVTRPLLGITVYGINTYLNTTSEYLEYIPAGAEYGLVVGAVTENGNGANGGILVNDCILKVNDTTITSVTAISEVLHKSKNGDTISLYIYRKSSNEYKTLNITLSC